MRAKIETALTWMALTGLPALPALYIMLAGIWGFPLQQEITETILAVVIFIVTVTGISKAKGAGNEKS